MRLLALCIFLVAVLGASCAFVSLPRPGSAVSRRSLMMATARDWSNDEIEQKRQRLEAMIAGSLSSSNDDDDAASSMSVPLEQKQGDDSQTPVMERQRSTVRLSSRSLPDDPPPLTAIGKERRIKEIQLLAQLSDSDETLDELWSFWYNERGNKAANELRQVEELTSQGPRAFAEAEERLLGLIDQHGLYFSEAVNRLATLYFLWGRLEESKACCEIVLAHKPWHVGALSGIVMVCAGMGDATEARRWAARRLPPIQPTGSNKRRQEWVESALNDSTRSLLAAEKRVKNMFGLPDRRYKVNTFDDHDAWQ